MNVKSTADEGSEGSEEHSRESMHCLRENIYIYIIINRVLIEILMFKVLLVRAQKDTRNMLLETRGKKVLII